MRFYTYSHQTADTGKIFYIGRGKEGNATQRWKSTGHRNAHWRNIVNKHGFTAKILAYWSTLEEANSHEKLLISCFKDMGYKLANKTDGGDGSTGHVQTPELKAWRSQKMQGNTYAKGAVKSKERVEAQSAIMKGNKFAERKTPETRAKNGRSKAVICVENGLKFGNMQLAAEWLNNIRNVKTGHSPISLCCNGKRKSAYGYTWVYTNKEF